MRVARTEDGVTLLEVLVAVSILGIAFSSILGAMGVSIIGSDRHRAQADAHIVVLRAAENIKALPATSHFDCTTSSNDLEDAPRHPPYVDAARAAAPSRGWEVRVIAVRFIQPDDGVWRGPPKDPFGDDCESGGRYYLATQLITVEAKSPSGRAAERLTFARQWRDG